MRRPRKILQLAPYFSPSVGGIENHVMNLSRKLIEEGYEVEVLTPRHENSVPSEKIVTHRTLCLRRFRKAVFSPSIMSKLLLLDYDLIHVHAPFHFGLEFSVFISQILRRKPLVITLHIYGGSNDFLYRLYDKLVYDNCLKIAKLVIVTTGDYVSHLPVLNELKNKIEEIPMAVDTDFFYPRNSQRIQDKLHAFDEKIILFVGSLERYHQYKRVDDLIRAFSAIAYQRNDVTLVIVGEGELADNLKTLAHNLGVGDKVYFEGLVPYAELPEYYSAADVTVLPSIGRAEAFGIVLLEAMACGCPIVGPNLMGVRKVIDDVGVTFQVGNLTDLAEKICFTLNGDRSAFGRKGRERALRTYSWNRVIKKISRVYEELYARAKN